MSASDTQIRVAKPRSPLSRYNETLDIHNRLQREGVYRFGSAKTSELELTAAQIIEGLEPHITPERTARIEGVLEDRTFNVAVVMEHLCDLGNVSAVMRSAESFGFLPVHILEQEDARYKKSDRISKGSEKWLDIHRSKDNVGAIRELQRQGFQVVATTLDNSVPISSVDFSKPTAIVLGNEKEGVSPEVAKAADIRAAIPMSGFTQSFNISVAAAILFFHIHGERAKKLGRSGDLTADEKLHLKAQYYLRTLESAEAILKNKLK